MSALSPLFRRLIIRSALRRAIRFVLTALPSFVAIEGVTQYASQKLQTDIGGSWAGALSAVAITSIWAFVAHQRFTFKGLAPRVNVVAGAACLFVLTLAALDGVTLLSALWPSVTPLVWVLLEGTKYAAMRALIWPGMDGRAAFALID